MTIFVTNNNETIHYEQGHLLMLNILPEKDKEVQRS